MSRRRRCPLVGDGRAPSCKRREIRRPFHHPYVPKLDRLGLRFRGVRMVCAIGAVAGNVAGSGALPRRVCRVRCLVFLESRAWRGLVGLLSLPPCGSWARGCRLAQIGQVYARVHEWCFGRVWWQAPCVCIDLLNRGASLTSVSGKWFRRFSVAGSCVGYPPCGNSSMSAPQNSPLWPQASSGER